MTNDTIKSTPIFDQPVILERRPFWSSIFVWTIMAMTVSGVAWAAWAEIDQSVASAGKLEPAGGGVEVKAPTGGIVREIHVKGGDFVQQGDLLITFDPTAPEADVESLRQLRESLMRENQFYQAALNGKPVSGATAELQALVKLRSDLVSENQFLEAAVNGVATLGGTGAFDANQEQLLRASRSELDTRVAAARLQVQELKAQLQQTKEQIPSVRNQLNIAKEQETTAQASLETARRQLPTAEARLETARRQIPTAKARIEIARRQIPTAQARVETARRQIPTAKAQLETAQQALALNEDILSRIEPLVYQGALSELQKQRQEQEVLNQEAQVSNREAELLSRQNELAALEAELLNRQNEVAALEAELLNRQNEISALETEVLNRQNEILARQAELDRRREEVVTRDAELTRLQNEVQRLEAAIGRAEQQLENTQFASQKEIRTKIADNQKRISDIDSQLSRSLLENQKKIAQIESQLTRAQLQLEYQELRAPVAGQVFDLQPNAPGFVVRETEPLLKLVRDAKLEASVLIQNQDIALVLDALRKNQAEGKKGVPVEVMIEAFPATEFGTVNGTLTKIGSDVLEPNPQKGQNFYAFPATIELDSEKFILDNGLQVSLHSGMAVQAKIKIGRRTVLQLFISRLTNQTRGLETVK